MDYVVVRAEGHGYFLDPTRYLAALKTLAPQLPPGARAHAEDPEHYNFYGLRCVKDLEFGSFLLTGGGRNRLRLLPNIFKHDEGLDMDYEEVRQIAVEPSSADGLLGSVLLNELRPDGDGVCHEVRLTGGTIRIVARDVTAHWLSVSWIWSLTGFHGAESETWLLPGLPDEVVRESLGFIPDGAAEASSALLEAVRPLCDDRFQPSHFDHVMIGRQVNRLLEETAPTAGPQPPSAVS